MKRNGVENTRRKSNFGKIKALIEIVKQLTGWVIDGLRLFHDERGSACALPAAGAEKLLGKKR